MFCDLTFRGHKLNWKVIQEFVYMFHTNIGDGMYCLGDISRNR